jgi:hypothetical protein
MVFDLLRLRPVAAWLLVEEGTKLFAAGLHHL